eukprot:g2617.t1
MVGADGGLSKTPWRFALFPTYDEATASLCGSGEGRAGGSAPTFAAVDLPAHWELLGYDPPIYTNVIYPFTRFPVAQSVPDGAVNPCGVYVLDLEDLGHFSTAEGALARRKTNSKVQLVFEGVCSCIYLYVNGRFVGYGEDSMTETAFDIGALLRDQHQHQQKNTIVAVVPKFCSGSYLECQDMWTLSGIFRPVFLEFLPTALNKEGAAAGRADIIGLGDDEADIRIPPASPPFNVTILDYRVIADWETKTLALDVEVELESEVTTFPTTVGVFDVTASLELQRDEPASPTRRRKRPDTVFHQVFAVDSSPIGASVERLPKVAAMQQQHHCGSVERVEYTSTSSSPDEVTHEDTSAHAKVVAAKKRLYFPPREVSTVGDRDLLPWSPETPNLYKLDIIVKRLAVTEQSLADDATTVDILEELGFDEGSASTSAAVGSFGGDFSLNTLSSHTHSTHTNRNRSESCKVGFRTVEVGVNRNHPPNVLTVNGQPIVIKGVNRHEFNHNRGRVLSEKDLLQDIALLKAGNFNAVRCAHYPNTRRWYELCDEYGLFVVDECNVETHGFSLNGVLDVVHCDPRWRNALLQRARACYGRTKNHACVIGYSLGNEAGFGPNLYANYLYFLEQTTWYQEVEVSGGAVVAKGCAGGAGGVETSVAASASRSSSSASTKFESTDAPTSKSSAQEEGAGENLLDDDSPGGGAAQKREKSGMKMNPPATKKRNTSSALQVRRSPWTKASSPNQQDPLELQLKTSYSSSKTDDLEGSTQHFSHLFRTHFIQYEGGKNYSNEPVFSCGDGSTLCSDLICPMYWAPWDIEKIAQRQNASLAEKSRTLLEDGSDGRRGGGDEEAKMGTLVMKADAALIKPIIQCEFAHAWGNSCASIEKFWQLYYDKRYPQIQGGFIWEWADACLADAVVADGSVTGGARSLWEKYNKRQPAAGAEGNIGAASSTSSSKVPASYYGGDFGPTSGYEDNSFVADGLLNANRINVHPAFYEVQALQRPVFFEFKTARGARPADVAGEDETYIHVQNRFDFNSLAGMCVDVLAEVEVSVKTSAGGSATSQCLQVAIELENPSVAPKGWTRAQVPVRAIERRALAEVVAQYQSAGIAVAQPEAGGRAVDENKGCVRLQRVFAMYNGAADRLVGLRRLASIGLARSDFLLGEKWYLRGTSCEHKTAEAERLLSVAETMATAGRGSPLGSIREEAFAVKYDIPPEPTPEARRAAAAPHALTILQNIRLEEQPGDEDEEGNGAAGTTTTGRSTNKTTPLIERIEWHFVRAPVENDRGGMDIELAVGGRWLAKNLVNRFLPASVSHNLLSYAWLWARVFRLFSMGPWSSSSTAENRLEAEKRTNRDPSNVTPQDSTSVGSGGFRLVSCGWGTATGAASGGLVSPTSTKKADRQNLLANRQPDGSVSPSRNRAESSGSSSFSTTHRSDSLKISAKTTITTLDPTNSLHNDLAVTSSANASPSSSSIYSRLVLDCEVDCRYAVTNHLPRIGLRFKLPKKYASYQYCAMGPYENYADRGRTCCHFGVFEEKLCPAGEADVGKQCLYAKPQEFGARAEACWVKFANDMAVSIKGGNHITTSHSTSRAEEEEDEENENSEDPLWLSRRLLSVSSYSTEQLATVRHAHELEEEDCTWLCLDVAHMGIGGVGGKGNVWGFDPDYVLPEKKLWRFQVEIKLY